MTNNAKEKAMALVEKFRNELSWVEKDYAVDLYREAMQCAIIAVNLAMEMNNVEQVHMYPDVVVEGETLIGGRQFWEQVKEQISLL